VARVALGPALHVLRGRWRAAAELLELADLRLEHALAVLVVYGARSRYRRSGRSVTTWRAPGARHRRVPRALIQPRQS
jgi:hypothetical protein